MRVRLGGALFAFCLCAGILTATAGAKEVRLPLASFGSFAEPKGLAVDQGFGEIYVIAGRSEVQRITISVTAGGSS